MNELEIEVFLAQKRLLIRWLDLVLTGEDLSDVIEETKYLVNYEG
jgi:hypothetical protein